MSHYECLPCSRYINKQIKMYTCAKVYKGVRSNTGHDRPEYNITVITSARAEGTKLLFSLQGAQKETFRDTLV